MEEFRTHSLQKELREEAREARNRLEAGMQLVAPLLNKLEQAYAGQKVGANGHSPLRLRDLYKSSHSQCTLDKALIPFAKVHVLDDGGRLDLFGKDCDSPAPAHRAEKLLD